MAELFQNVLTASLYGAVLIAAVLLIRLLLKKAPKKYICLLWLLAGLRLLMPFEIQSRLSLQPDLGEVTVPGMEYVQQVTSGFNSGTGNTRVPSAPNETHSVEIDQDTGLEIGQNVSVYEVEVPLRVVILENYERILAWVWAIVAAGLLVYSAVSYALLKRRVRDAVILDDRVWVSGKLESAFVLGFFRPQIYLNAALPESDRRYVLTHENCHIRRGDPWWKGLGFIILSIHWFNPLVWVSYVLLCKDLEMACDEAVVKDMDVGERKAYSAALLSCSAKGHTIAACPVAFGEVSVKARIKGVLNYRKPKFWILLITVIAFVAVAVCFLTNPVGQDLSFLNCENAVSLAAEKENVIAVWYRANVSGGSLSVCKADGSQVAAFLDNAAWRSWLVSDSHGGFTAYVDLQIRQDYTIRIFNNGHADVTYGEEVRHYRVPGADYETVKAMLSDATAEDVRAAGADHLLDWGVTLWAANVSRTGLVLVCCQDGTVVAGQLGTGSYYWLERWSDGSWTAVEELPLEDGVERGWTSELRLIPAGGTTRWEMDWSHLYGELPDGTYRIGKTISLSQNTGESADQTLYAQFTLGDREPITSSSSFVYEGEGCGGDFTITLMEDGTFTYYEGMLSSYIGLGTWTLEGDILCLTDSEEVGYGFVNYFRVEDDTLVFLAENSDNFLYVKVADGEKFA